VSGTQVPGTAALNQGRFAEILSVSCASAGNCSAGGSYLDISLRRRAFVVNQADGTWGTAQQVSGTAALSPKVPADLGSVSCTAAGTCTGGGIAGVHPFVVDETNGTWGTAQVVPGIATLSHGRPGALDWVSCASPGNCAASGYYVYLVDGSARTGVFVAAETNGTWGTAQALPGIRALNQGDALPYSVSCGAPSRTKRTVWSDPASIVVFVRPSSS
jgi:hypothetical protein